MSNKSTSRLIAIAQTTDVDLRSMITLTYPAIYPKDGLIVKGDIHYFMQWIRRTFGTEYLWFLEFQKRGAPHVHVLVQPKVLTPYMRAKLGLTWTERIALSDWFVKQCELLENKGDNGKTDVYRSHILRMVAVNTHREVWEILRRTDGAKRYVAKYAAKSYQKVVPEHYANVGRFWGCSREVKAVWKSGGRTIDVTESEVRQYLADHDHAVANWDVIPKIIFGVDD